MGRVERLRNPFDPKARSVGRAFMNGEGLAYISAQNIATLEPSFDVNFALRCARNRLVIEDFAVVFEITQNNLRKTGKQLLIIMRGEGEAVSALSQIRSYGLISPPREAT